MEKTAEFYCPTCGKTSTGNVPSTYGEAPYCYCTGIGLEMFPIPDSEYDHYAPEQLGGSDEDTLQTDEERPQDGSDSP